MVRNRNFTFGSNKGDLGYSSENSLFIDALAKKIEECRRVEKESAKKVTDLENKMKNIKSLRETELKNAENEMKRLKKKSDESRNLWQQREQVSFLKR